MAGRIGIDELVVDAELGIGGLKQSGQVALAVGKPVGKLKSVVGLGILYLDTSAGIPFDQLFEEVGAKNRIVAHISDRLELCFRVLVGVTLGPPGLTGQGRPGFHPSGLSRSRCTTSSSCISD